MAPKKKGRKRAKKDPAKQQAIEALIEDLEEKIRINLEDMRSDIEEGCERIDRIYDDLLKSINPEHLHLTLDQIAELAVRTPVQKIPEASAATALINRFQSARKASVSRTSSSKSYLNNPLERTFNLNSSRQRSMMMNTKMKKKMKQSGQFATPSGVTRTGTLKRRILSTVQPSSPPGQKKNKFTGMVTPSSVAASKARKLRNHRIIVTPKFDPQVPIPLTLMRKAKPGEVIMSMSGSPIQNPVASLPSTGSQRPVLLMSLKDNRVIDVTDNSRLDAIPVSALNAETKANILRAKRTLASIL